MDRCPNCGASVRPNARFCTACGHRLTPTEPATPPVSEAPAADIGIQDDSTGPWDAVSTTGDDTVIDERASDPITPPVEPADQHPVTDTGADPEAAPADEDPVASDVSTSSGFRIDGDEDSAAPLDSVTGTEVSTSNEQDTAEDESGTASSPESPTADPGPSAGFVVDQDMASQDLESSETDRSDTMSEDDRVIALGASSDDSTVTSSENPGQTPGVFSWSDSSIGEAASATSADEDTTGGRGRIQAGAWTDLVAGTDSDEGGSDATRDEAETTDTGSMAGWIGGEAMANPPGAGDDSASQPGSDSSDWESWSSPEASHPAESGSDSRAIEDGGAVWSPDADGTEAAHAADTRSHSSDAPYGEEPRTAADAAADGNDLLRMVDELRAAVSEALNREAASTSSPASDQLAEARQILSGTADPSRPSDLDGLEQAIADVETNEFDYRHLQALGGQRAVILALLTAYRQRGDTIDQLRSIVSSGDPD